VDGDATTQTKFNYAWGLIKSKRAADQQFGVQLLTGNNNYFHGLILFFSNPSILNDFM
jgi:hypothetical protein